MKNAIIVIFLSVFVSGCATIGSVDKNYSKIKREDGISEREAKLIAKKVLMDSDHTEEFRLTHPEILSNNHTDRQPHYWFVKAVSKKAMFADAYYFVVINKKSGDVVYAKRYNPYPSFAKGYDWIVSRH